MKRGFTKPRNEEHITRKKKPKKQPKKEEHLPPAYVTTRISHHNPKSIHARPTKLQKKPKTYVEKDTNKGQSLLKTLRRTLRSYQSPLKTVRVSLTKTH